MFCGVSLWWTLVDLLLLKLRFPWTFLGIGYFLPWVNFFLDIRVCLHIVCNSFDIMISLVWCFLCWILKGYKSSALALLTLKIFPLIGFFTVLVGLQEWHCQPNLLFLLWLHKWLVVHLCNNITTFFINHQKWFTSSIRIQAL